MTGQSSRRGDVSRQDNGCSRSARPLDAENAACDPRRCRLRGRPCSTGCVAVREEGAMIGTILVPLDGSRLSRHAMPYASHLAQAMHARLVVFYAYQAKTGDVETDPELDLVREQADLASGMRQRGIHATTWLSYDEPGPAIVKTAEDLQADLIVMSTHGRGGVSQVM